MSLIRYRDEAVSQLPAQIGVYALCDLDNIPIYVGKSKDGIRQRVQRHLTSARSDIIANRQIDVWEIAYVWCWPVNEEAHLTPLEGHFFHLYHSQHPLMNGSVPRQPPDLSIPVPERTVVQVLPTDEIESRTRPEVRLPRQANHFTSLLDHYLNVKDSRQIHLALRAHFDRLQRYFAQLQGNDHGHLFSMMSIFENDDDEEDD